MDITERKLIQEQIKRLNDDLLARNEQLESLTKSSNRSSTLLHMTYVGRFVTYQGLLTS